MANALARETTVRYLEGVGLQLLLDCAIFGPEVTGGGLTTEVEVTLPANPTAVEVRSAMSAAVADKATELGYTVAPTAMTLPSWQKG